MLIERPSKKAPVRRHPASPTNRQYVEAANRCRASRSYFHAQTLLTRSVIDKDRSSSTAVTHVYDRNGNLGSDGEKHVYRYNPWCQLVEVQAYGVWPIKVLARYSYTATGQRVTEEYDTNADGAVTSSDVMTIIASDTSGRRVASFVDHGDFFAKETFFHHPPHIRGPGFAGGPIVRDRNEDLVDPNRWKRAATEERLERRYYATDWQGRVVSLVTAAGEKAEDYRYSATGVPFGIPLGDVNADGKVDGGSTGADYTLAFDQEDGGVYDARVDLNLDQVLDSTDVAMVAGQDGVATGRGELSARFVSSRINTIRTEWQSALQLDLKWRGSSSHLGILINLCMVLDSPRPRAAFQPIDEDSPCFAGCRDNVNSPALERALDRVREACSRVERMPRRTDRDPPQDAIEACKNGWKTECDLAGDSEGLTNCFECRIRLRRNAPCYVIVHELTHAADMCEWRLCDYNTGNFAIRPRDGNRSSARSCDAWICSEARAFHVSCCLGVVRSVAPRPPFTMSYESCMENYKRSYLEMRPCGPGRERVWNKCLEGLSCTRGNPGTLPRLPEVLPSTPQ